MAFSAIQQYLKSITGLDVDTVGSAIVERAVRRRMEVCDIVRVSQYGQLIRSSAVERQALINELSVPETWFFRDEKPFQLLGRLAREFIGHYSRVTPLRILSVPCSTGEEAYSIAMTLLDAGYHSDQFTIDAVDISTAVIETAQRGLYGRNSFRGNELDYRQRYFTPQGQHYLVNEVVKSSISFQQGNLIDDHFMASQPPYHVIFCRNLLIYFDLEHKQKALKCLHSLLASEGVLFLGHAETGRMAQGLFVSAGVAGAFAYRKEASTTSRPQPSETDLSGVMQSLTEERSSVVADGGDSVLRIEERLPQAPVPPSGSSLDSTADSTPELGGCYEQQLAEIEQLADCGELAQASQLCEALLAQRPDIARCHYLQGIIHLAGQQDEAAVEAFRRALYLQPDHYQSLVHLSALAEKRGDANAAQNYRARAQRIAQERSAN